MGGEGDDTGGVFLDPGPGLVGGVSKPLHNPGDGKGAHPDHQEPGGLREQDQVPRHNSQSGGWDLYHL